MSLLNNIGAAIIFETDVATWERINVDFAESLFAVAAGSPINTFTDLLEISRDVYGLSSAQVITIAATVVDRPLPPTMVLWAEENAVLGAANTYEWAFGNGASTNATSGFVMPFGTWEVRGMGLHIGGTAGTRTATVRLRVNQAFPAGIQVVVPVGTSEGDVQFPKGTLTINAGDLLNFQTLSSTGTAAPCVVSVALERIA